MTELGADELMFFEREPRALPIYAAFAQRMRELFPSATVKVQKTQISFTDRYGFAWASLPAGKRRGWPEVCLIVTFGLPLRLASPRIKVAVEPYPNRWTHHVPIESAEGVDAELMGWVARSHEFSLNK